MSNVQRWKSSESCGEFMQRRYVKIDFMRNIYEITTTDPPLPIPFADRVKMTEIMLRDIPQWFEENKCLDVVDVLTTLFSDAKNIQIAYGNYPQQEIPHWFVDKYINT
ncbi:MAG: hypothetical protein Sylvanvirus4_32 [Sylvanvirus sp.]|uniref:Uncharacterized protein n=1 Tax=Sylvanvirus sp. TaxID=2487774 RepID=A0A3G5AHK3_9VIRU|nr:MAG: hypothetical protein Sylvanvirus4_32 [Sylvanvirus sp.]